MALPLEKQWTYADVLAWDEGGRVEPDLTVVCDPDKLDDAGCKGAPLICPAYFPNKRKKAGEIPLLFYPNIEEGKTGSSVP